MSDVAAIVLAAGSASRFRASAGKNGPVTKLVALLDGKALVRRVAEAALASRARPVIVVTGHARAEVEAALVGLPLRFIHNADFASGLASSLKAGIAAAPADAQGALILLGDMPDLSVGVIDALIAARAAHPGAKAIVPFVYAIGKLYSTKVGGRTRQPRMVIELEGAGNITAWANALPTAPAEGPGRQAFARGFDTGRGGLHRPCQAVRQTG